MMTLARPPPHDPNPPSTMRSSTDNGDESIRENLLDTSEKGMLPQSLPPRSGLNLKSALKIALFLFLAIFYLTFCLVVRHRIIPIGRSGVLGLPFIHFSTESGITTIAILIVYVALWPVDGLRDEIRSEEFFRLLSTYPNGVPLDSVNAVSNPTTGAFDIFLATIHRRCSLFLTSTLAITLMITATASLAPAALNTQSITIDVDDPAFRVGAIPKGSYTVDVGYSINTTIVDLFSQASTMSWVENALNITNTYHTVEGSEDDPFVYLVPLPPGYSAVMQAYWTTDIIILDPSCSWQTPNATLFLHVGWDVTLVPANLNVFLTNDSFVSDPPTSTKASVMKPINESAASFTVPLDGSALFVISQVGVGGLSTVPTLQLSGNIYAFLLCSPHASIQTRRVRATGNGILSLGQTQKIQGNLDPYQINYLLSDVLSDFATSSGPTTGFDVGTDMMTKLLFGHNYRSVSNVPPAPLSNITVVYKQIIQPAMKTLLSGAISTANVPGGFVKEQVVFRSSLGHVVTSAILFALLVMVLVAAQFRTGRDAFTLVDVAAVLADSDAPQKCIERKQLAGASERKILRLVPSGDGGLICTYENFEPSSGVVHEARRDEMKDSKVY